MKYQKLSNNIEDGEMDTTVVASQSESIVRIPEFSLSFSYILNVNNWFFHYFNPLIRNGNEGIRITKDHLLHIPNDMTAKVSFQKLCKLWTIEELRTELKRNVNNNVDIKKNNKLWNALHSLIFTEFWYAGAARLLNDIAVVTGAALIKQIISASVSGSFTYTLLIAFAITINSISQTLFLSQFVNSAFMCGSKVVTATSAAVFQSTLCLRIEKMKPSKTLGEINNIQSKDASSLREFVVFAHNLWACPLMIVVCATYLVYLLQWAGLVSCILLPLLIPVESYISKKCKGLRKEALSSSDKRMALVNELIDGMKTVKLTNLVPFIYEKIKQLRNEELGKAWQFMVLETVNTVIVRSGSLLITLLTFTVYIYSQSASSISADKAFTALALINILGRPMQLIPKSITLLNEAIVSCERIESIILEGKKYNKDLMSFDLKKNSKQYLSIDDDDDEEEIDHQVLYPVDTSAKVITNDLSVYRSENQVIKNLSVNISGRGLVLIVGNNGSGKTSLLLALMKELNSTGKCSILPKNSLIAYCGHDPWIINNSALENVIVVHTDYKVFTSAKTNNFCIEDDDMNDDDTYNVDRFSRVVDQCALTEDFDTWPLKENTVLGEKGITVSGGQKQRLSLARALYSYANVLLLDSPISGLDVVVAKKVFMDAIVESARDRLVVMTCHQHEFLPYANRIIAMDNGQIIFDGGYESYAKIHSNQELIIIGKPHYDKKKNEKKDDDKSSDKTGKVKKSEKSDDISQSINSWSSYIEYLRACKFSNIAICVTLSLSAYGVSAFSDFLLAFWTDKKITSQQYLLFYFIVAIILIFVNISRYLMYSYSGITASYSLHHRLLQSVLGCTYQFFSTTPSGRISSRFSIDLNQIDFNIPDSLSSFVDAFLGICTGIGVIVLAAPLYIIIIIPITWKYMNVQKMYRNVAKDLKKIESGSSSPLFSYFREVINGLETIRGYKIQEKLINKHYSLLDASICARINWDMANRWMGIRLDLLGSIIVSAAAFAIAFTTSSTEGGQAGLMIAYAMRTTQSLTFAIRSSTALENMFTSCDRVKEYIELDQETSPNELPLQTNCSEVPQEVSPIQKNNSTPIIKGSNIIFSYPSSTTPVLKDISFVINRAKLIGICGRTGSGKSSITMFLSRLVHQISGTLLFDGVDTKDIPLVKYRSAIQVYPQDSYIFSGTLRSFLDPYALNNDIKLNKVIKELTNAGFDKEDENISKNKLTLDIEITANGSNLSAGQKQIAVLARAALSEAKVIILDEITSNMDAESSMKAVDIIKNELTSKGKSVLLVSHRMNEINICDEVWLLSDGQIIESGSPVVLNIDGTEYNRMMKTLVI